MTAPVTLDELKAHCRIDADHEDTILGLYLAAAIASVEQHLCVAEPLDSTAPAPIKAAILLHAAGLYAQREDVSDRPLHGNVTYARLLQPYRTMAA